MDTGPFVGDAEVGEDDNEDDEYERDECVYGAPCPTELSSTDDTEIGSALFVCSWIFDIREDIWVVFEIEEDDGGTDEP